MKNLSVLIVIFACAAVFAEPIQNVAVVETLIDEASGAEAEINMAEVREITNEIRGGAIRHLPGGRFNVMTTETVQSMGGAVLSECAEENCVITLGSKIGADYIVRGIISKFRQNVTLTVEIFETEYGMLLATATVRTANLDEILEKTDAACAAMYKSFTERLSETARVKAERQAAREAREAEEASAEQTSAPAITDQPPPKPAVTKPPREKKKSSTLVLTLRWSSVALAVGGVIGGIVCDGMANSEYDKYKASIDYQETQDTKKNTESLTLTRNLLYGLAGAGLCGFAVTWFF